MECPYFSLFAVDFSRLLPCVIFLMSTLRHEVSWNVFDAFPCVRGWCASVLAYIVLKFSIILLVIDKIIDRVFSWFGVVPTGLRSTPFGAHTFISTCRGRWSVGGVRFLTRFCQSHHVDRYYIMDLVHAQCNPLYAYFYDCEWAAFLLFQLSWQIPIWREGMCYPDCRMFVDVDDVSSTKH